MTEEATKQKILKTTLKIIGNEGVDGLTIRRIAKESGVNVASINYHFKSKEKLISDALRSYGSIMKKSFEILSETSLSPEEKLIRFLKKFSEQLIHYPGFVKSQVTRISEGKTMTPKAVANMKFGKKKILDLLTEIINGKSEKELSMLLFQMMAGIILPLLFGGYIKEIYGFSFEEDEDREDFITLSVKKLIESGA